MDLGVKGHDICSYSKKTQGKEYVSIEKESVTHRVWGRGWNTDKGLIEWRMYGCFTFILKNFPISFKLFPNENEGE